MVCLINLREKKCTKLTKEDGKPDAKCGQKRGMGFHLVCVVQKYGQGRRPQIPPEPVRNKYGWMARIK
jgi:hypothetical protein